MLRSQSKWKFIYFSSDSPFHTKLVRQPCLGFIGEGCRLEIQYNGCIVGLFNPPISYIDPQILNHPYVFMVEEEGNFLEDYRKCFYWISRAEQLRHIPAYHPCWLNRLENNRAIILKELNRDNTRRRNNRKGIVFVAWWLGGLRDAIF